MSSSTDQRPASDDPWRRLGANLAPLLAALAGSALLFWLVGLDSSYLTIDSGPYLSIAHNLVEQGRPVSSFGFLNSFDRLPSVPSFIPPGLGLEIALVHPLAGDTIGAARIVLWLSLFLTQLGAIHLLARRTGDLGYAVGASLLLIWNGRLGNYAGVVLTELPFVACLILATLAAVSVLEGRATRRVLYGGLPLASAMLCLTRYLGVFFPAVFSFAYLLRARRDRRPWRRTFGYLATYNLLALGPVLLWLAAARRPGAPLFPQRPPSQLDPVKALVEAGLHLATWVGPWLVLAAVLTGILKLLRAGPRQNGPKSGLPELFLALALVGYVGLLIAARTLGGALYPIGQLGERYLLPAWPLAFLLAAILLHRFVWSRRRFAVNAAVALCAGAGLWLGLQELLASRVPPPFPTETETYRAALDLLPPDAEEVVLCNFCQPLTHDRPSARVIGIPSRQDFIYEMDLAELKRRHDVGWIVLFDLGVKEQLYPSWFSRWLERPPPEVTVTRERRFRDGVIYRLEG